MKNLYFYMPEFLYTLTFAIGAIRISPLKSQDSSLKTVKMQNKPNSPLSRSSQSSFPAQYQTFSDRPNPKSAFPAQKSQTQFTPPFALHKNLHFRLYSLFLLNRQSKIGNRQCKIPKPNLPHVLPATRSLLKPRLKLKKQIIHGNPVIQSKKKPVHHIKIPKAKIQYVLRATRTGFLARYQLFMQNTDPKLLFTTPSSPNPKCYTLSSRPVHFVSPDLISLSRMKIAIPTCRDSAIKNYELKIMPYQ